MTEEFMILLLAGGAGYLIGSISFARLIFAWKRPGEEPPRIRTVSTDGEVTITSHAVGATNVMMGLGRKWGLTTMSLDLLKSFIPMALLKVAYPEMPYHLLLGLFVLIGHLWPIWHGFRGGGGNSSALGMILAASPLGFLVTQVSGMLIGMRFPVFTFLAGVAMTIPWFMMTKGVLSYETGFAVAMTVLYLLGQLPETMQFLRYKKAGYSFDTKHVVNMMKHVSRRKHMENEAGRKGSL
ncbi:glycerol-3-phosphate acyltransferase [Proteiniclasticum sp. SCR006]|uniref:Glycerol-3-phosphate acyltransferase n=1 Tax=Proteiniclasticum aestuarii TaxID=2817862 RepID=A0A939H5K1_9CLOT|nr:glycerol-3-phosphate acyltransferase [Proteiniclasticum aestuarii]MBO1264632.1 glycerol-3-phosphate acyltransferase [Proteiniclasticum aestuarii]